MNRAPIFSIFLPMIVLCIACEPTVAKPNFDTSALSDESATSDPDDSLWSDTGTPQSDTASASVLGNDTEIPIDAGADTDSTSDSPSDSMSGCESGSSQCNGDILSKCIDGAWRAWDDCDVFGMDCIAVAGTHQCAYSDTLTDMDTASDSDTGTDGDSETVPNFVDSPCYDEDADDGEVSCFTWASTTGPCSEAASACNTDSACSDLDACILDSWSSPDWKSIQEICFENASMAAETLYWNYMQCIYCDVCDVACKRDAGSKNCPASPDTDSDSEIHIDTDSTDDFSCKYDCVPHCVSWGGTAQDGRCEDNLRCCENPIIVDSAYNPEINCDGESYRVFQGGYVCAGPLHGDAWTSPGEVAGAQISPQNFNDARAGERLCITGNTAANTESVGVLGINTGQPVDEIANDGWVPEGDGLEVNVTKTGSFPLQLVVEAGGELYCTEIADGVSQINWSNLKTDCGKTGGMVFDGAGRIDAVMLLVPGDESAETLYDVCLWELNVF